MAPLLRNSLEASWLLCYVIVLRPHGSSVTYLIVLRSQGLSFLRVGDILHTLCSDLNYLGALAAWAGLPDFS
jgi:hypothetical protein